MPITSFDYLVKIMPNNNFVHWNWLHPTALVSGRGYDCYYASGSFGQQLTFNGTSTYFSGSTPLTWQPINSSNSVNGMTILPKRNNSTNETLHISYASAHTPATTTGGSFTLVDLQGVWPGINASSSSTQTLSGTPGSNLRYANGVGCQLYFVTTTATTGTAAAYNLSSISYTNQAGTTGRNLAYSNVNFTGFTSHPNGSIPHCAFTGTTISRMPGLFLPLAGNDTGVQNVASVTFAATTFPTAGNYALCLARPILTVPVSSFSGITNEVDFINQVPTLPEVKRDACLVWLFKSGSAGSANSCYSGAVNFVWG